MIDIKCALFLFSFINHQPLGIVYPLSCDVSKGDPFLTATAYNYKVVPDDFDIVKAFSKEVHEWEAKHHADDQ